jgi:hypothetical protein
MQNDAQNRARRAPSLILAPTPQSLIAPSLKLFFAVGNIAAHKFGAWADE